jgi:hypothetical protein
MSGEQGKARRPTHYDRIEKAIRENYKIGEKFFLHDLVNKIRTQTGHIVFNQRELAPRLTTIGTAKRVDKCQYIRVR